MSTLPLILDNGHVFVELSKNLWLFDTGAPSSFGDLENVVLLGEAFSIPQSYIGLSAAELSRLVGVECLGLLGSDLLGQFDHILDCESKTLSISKTELLHDGLQLPISDFMGIPILNARIAGKDHRMFFDTGARISYLQDKSLTDFPDGGSVADFYPGFGEFQTDTYQVEMSFANLRCTLRCGTLPTLLGMTLMLAGTQGIIGNQLLENRVIGYFPRRRTLCL